MEHQSNVFNINELVKLGVLKGDIYEFELHPDFPELYEQNYWLCQNFLSAMEEQEQIFPARFYYTSGYSVNAFARKDEYGYFVGVNMGYVHSLSPWLLKVNTLVKEIDRLKYYGTLPTYGGVSLGEYMFKIMMRFTFFHEQAHLRQNKDVLFSCSENQQGVGNTEYNEEKHAKEIDADISAATRVYFMMMVDYELYQEATGNKDAFFKYLCITIATVLLYFYRTHDNFLPVYYKAKEHPHPAIRIGYVLWHFMRLLTSARPFGYSFELPSVRSEIHHICKHVSGFDPEKMMEFADTHYPDMANYMKEMSEASEKYPYLISQRHFRVE